MKKFNIIDQDQWEKIKSILAQGMLNDEVYVQFDAMSVMVIMIELGFAKKSDLIQLVTQAITSSNETVQLHTIDAIQIMLETDVIGQDYSSDILSILHLLVINNTSLDAIVVEGLKLMSDKGIIGAAQHLEIMNILDAMISKPDHNASEILSISHLMFTKGIIDLQQAKYVLDTLEKQRGTRVLDASLEEKEHYFAKHLDSSQLMHQESNDDDYDDTLEHDVVV